MAGFLLVAPRMRASIAASLLFLCSAALAVSCGDGGGGGGGAPVADAGAAPAHDAGARVDASPDAADAAPPVPYPAPHAPMPLVVSGGGPLLLAEHVVTVTFDNEPNATLVQAFGDSITQTPYWQTISAEYCVDPQHCIGPGTPGEHVTIHLSPAGTVDIATIEPLLSAHILDGTLPRPTPDTLYALYFAPGVVVGTTGFTGCKDFDAYHSFATMTLPSSGNDAGAPDASASDATAADAGETDGGASDAGASEAGGSDSGPGVDTTYAYAVMLRCAGGNAELTLAAGHEFIEAATDPFGTGYTVNDPAFGEFFYPEVGDLCDFDPPLNVGGYNVQRTWSNAAAKAGKNPCVPEANGVYFNAAPAKASLSLTVGGTATVEIDAFSEAPTEDWALGVIDVSALVLQDPTLDLSLDQTTANNGTKATLTVKLLKIPAGAQGDAVFAITSTRGSTKHYWPARVLPK